MNEKNKIRIVRSFDKKISILSLDIIDINKYYVICTKSYKNIEKGKMYFVKCEGVKKGQAYYLLKGRWVHCTYIRKLTDRELNAYARKKKIKKLLNSK